MKKILLFLVALVATLSMNAQTTEIYNGNTKEASYSGADVTVKFGVDGSEPTIEVYKGNDLMETYKGSDYKVVSKELPPTTGTAKATIGGNDVDVKWIQLWENGPKFAEYNVGVTDGKAESYGGYYAWGGSQDKVDDHNTTNTGSGNLSGSDDTATKLWGSNWRMPTADELGKKDVNGAYVDGLLGKCTCAWITLQDADGQEVKDANGKTVKGLLCTGKGDYASNSVFFPAVGFYSDELKGQGLNGYYWSSTPNGSNSAYDLNFAEEYKNVSDGYNRVNWYCVRAVLKELPPYTGTAKATIGGSEVDVNWVQLWENGPKFAEYNVGVTDGKAESYGGYYCWGKATDKDSQGAYKDGTSALTGTDDTATNLWGSNWRMPTKAEFEALLANCNVEWTTINSKIGRKFTGKGAYASNSVFLPTAGYCIGGSVYEQGDYGYYWSSTPNGSSNAYDLYFTSGFQRVGNCDRYYGYSVRAVLKELPPSTGTAKATIAGEEVDVNWVQLWENGPKFAEKNVGASSATETGTQMTFTDAVKTGADYVWGANWCTPSKDQMDELLKAASSSGSEKVKCVYTQEDGKWGFKFTGKETGYASNSVFFPAQDGDSDFGIEYYWSATANGSQAWGMGLRYDLGNCDSNWYSRSQDFACLVRPVFKN